MGKQKRIIAVETSGRIGSVAVGLDDCLLAQRQFSGALQHSKELMPTIDRIVADQSWRPSDIDELYVSAGPGSFTGIRIAVTLAKTLAFATKMRISASWIYRGEG